MREKQIEELKAILLEDRGSDCENCEFYKMKPCYDNYLANRLYNAVYRKQNEGEWGFDGMSWTCSECGEYAPIDKHRNTIKSKFCPNCGAHMKVTIEPKNYPPYLDRPKGGAE